MLGIKIHHLFPNDTLFAHKEHKRLHCQTSEGSPETVEMGKLKFLINVQKRNGLSPVKNGISASGRHKSMS